MVVRLNKYLLLLLLLLGSISGFAQTEENTLTVASFNIRWVVRNDEATAAITILRIATETISSATVIPHLYLDIFITARPCLWNTCR